MKINLYSVILLSFLGTLNTSSTNNTSNTGTAVKTPPLTAKNAVKDQKIFSSAKPIDPVWLAQTKIETANIVNAKLLVYYIYNISLLISVIQCLN